MIPVQNSLVQLVSPMNLSLVLACIAALLFLFGRRRRGLLFLAGAVGWIWLWSLPALSEAVHLSLATRYPERPVAEYPRADAVVVLDGATAPSRPRRFPYPDLDAASARVWQVALLYHARKAPLVVVVARQPPGAGRPSPEAAGMRRLLVALGVPGQAILQTSHGGTLHARVLALRPLLARHDLYRVLLVTAALRMPRAAATFRAAGIDVLPAPPRFGRQPAHDSAAWIPDAQALADSSRALHEYAELAVYRLRGWALPPPRDAGMH